MIAQWEQNEITRGVNDIIFNLNHVPLKDLAYFLVKFNPNLADELVDAIDNEFFDKQIGEVNE